MLACFSGRSFTRSPKKLVFAGVLSASACSAGLIISTRLFLYQYTGV